MTTVVSVATGTLIAESIQRVNSNNVGIGFGGGSTNDKSGQGARVKDAADTYDVWDDDWSE